VHLFLTIVTGGLWLVSWASIFLGHQLRPWRCQQCGWHKPLLRARETATATPDARGVRSARGK